MKVYNIPIHIDKSMYKSALDRFIEISSDYIESLYTFGNVSHYGLSDMDLIIVPKDHYLAPLKLEMRKIAPSCYKNIVLHNPFIIPESKLGIFKYYFSSNVKLYYGTDALRNVEMDKSYTNKLCTALEGLLSYHRILSNIKQSQKIDARFFIPVFSSLRFSIELLHDVNIVPKMAYDFDFDQLRDQFLSSKSELLVLDMYYLFENTLNQVSAIVMDKIGIDTKEKESVAGLYNGFSEKVLAFDKHFAQSRLDDIKDYLIFLSNNNYTYGSPFRKEFHGKKPLKFSYKLLRKIYHKIK